MQNLNNSNKFPYPTKDYFLRLSWVVLSFLFWRICWHRFYFLRVLILKAVGAKVSWNSMYFSTTKILRPWDFEAGRYVALGPRVIVYNLNKISIGDNSVISQDVYLCGGTHDYTISTLPLMRKDIVIEKNVWIGAGAFIGPGVTIGEGAVVAARAVVVKSVEPWTIVGGNPAKFIKKRVIEA
jgi:putative colanic acid biosynthesis acetyltransferase WcaF